MYFRYVEETPESIAQDQAIVEAIRRGDLSLKEGLTTLNNFGHMTLNFFEEKNGNVLRQTMQEKLGEKPELVYETTAELYRKNLFQGELHDFDTFFQRQYAYEFLQAAPLLPTVFKVPETRPEFQAPEKDSTIKIPHSETKPSPISAPPTKTSIGTMGIFDR